MMNPLFAKELSRFSLLSLPNKNDAKEIKISVYRNHSFEMVASVLNKFLNFSDLRASFSYSDYDDSLNFQEKQSDLNIIWLDLTRYKINDISSFIKERAEKLREISIAPTLIIYTSGKNEFISSVSDTYLIHLENVLELDINQLYNNEKQEITGTRLSNIALMECSRLLGMKYIPALFKPSIKAIVVDLDNTLYSGVLGEDGIKSISPNIDLQILLKGLQEKGYFLCIASKNDESDVLRLFEERSDFALKLKDFTLCEINWNPKSSSIVNIASKLNIGLDAILFIDDNPAELQNVEHLPIKTLLADANITQKLKYYPGLLKLRMSEEDKLRSIDVKANEERKRLAKQLTPTEYFEKLQLHLEFYVNAYDQLNRVVELLGKTNQFIFNYLRPNEQLVSEYMQASDKCVITVKMSDKLSDSGIIAIILAHNDNGICVIDDLTISCRALGRNLENIMIPKMLQLLLEVLKTSKTITIKYVKGARNMPAITWLQSVSSNPLEGKGSFEYEVPNVIEMNNISFKLVK